MGVWDYVPLQKNFFRNRTVSWPKASWKPTLHIHFVNEEGPKALFEKLGIKSQDL